MRIMIIGGAGLMGRVTALDLVESPDVAEIVVAAYQVDKAEEIAKSFKDIRVTSCFVDATDIDTMASVIKGWKRSGRPGRALAYFKF